ncbi:type VII secretion-associated serine protease mycosin [Kitasatospora sp. NPDC088548]|uniref:type VII secretion-associated serine protease mycosin n=1 Tax=Kitasatospora sp. NPDC088548 TaxID=3364075 RepID=UPI0037F71B9B
MLLAAGVVFGPGVLPAAAVDSIRDQQWHLDVMKASDMWKTSKGQGVTVAVIDSGFKLDHPDLAGQLLPGKDFSGLPGGIGSYAEGHGTAMASLIAGSGKGMAGKGAYGLAPGAKILPLKIKNGSDGGAVTSSELLGQIGQAVTYAADQGARVINISQGISATRTFPDDVANLNSVIAHANAKGALVVSSVGNSAQSGNPVEYPGGLPHVVGVGAADQKGIATTESEQGAQVDLVAPGTDMYGACTGPSGYCKSHGTSDAAAIVSASAALVWAVHPDWTPNQVLRVLINTAGKPTDGSGRNDAVGYGVVRPRIALTEPGDPGPADLYPIAEQPVGGPTSSALPTPSVSETPSAAASAGSGAAPAEDSTPVGSPVAQPEADGVSGSGSVVPLVVAVVVGLVLVAGVVFFVVRRRSAARQVAVVPPVGYPQGQGQGQGQGQLPSEGGPGAPPSYGPSAPPSDNPYAR